MDLYCSWGEDTSCLLSMGNTQLDTYVSLYGHFRNALKISVDSQVNWIITLARVILMNDGTIFCHLEYVHVKINIKPKTLIQILANKYVKERTLFPVAHHPTIFSCGLTR